MKSALTVLLMLALALAACHPGRHRQMQQQLADLQACNQADSLLTDLPLAQSLAEWFDGHGTANEQLLAHYLLGRTHADRGEAPAAIAAYHDAVERVERQRERKRVGDGTAGMGDGTAGMGDGTTGITTAADCDFIQLAKVYGQMGELLYWQNLMQNALGAYEKAYWNAMAGSDTLLAIIYFEQKAKCYYDMGKPDSMRVVINEARRLYLQHGDTLSANTAVESLIYLSIEEKDFPKAAEYINIYGHHSRTAKDTLSYQESWGLFRIYSGLYHLGLHHLDSAVCYFNQGLTLTTNPNNRLEAYIGLYETYKELGIADSIAKYAGKSIQANDSAVNTHIADQVQRVQALYNYDRFRIEADRLSIEAGQVRQKLALVSLVFAIFIAVTIVIVAVIIIRRHRKRARKLQLKVKYVADTLLVKTFSDELKKGNRQPEQTKAIAEKIRFLEESLSNQSKELETEAFKESFQESDIVELIRRCGQEGRRLPDACWGSLRQAINVYAPSFMFSLSQLNASLDLSDTQLCQLALIRDMPQKAKAAVMGLEYHAVAMKRKRLFKVLFGRDGSARDLETSLQRMAFGAA
jgi:tetratricopeptide (TPR) repeat protein